MPEHADSARKSWACTECPWNHSAHPTYGWSADDDRAVEVHRTMLCPGRSRTLRAESVCPCDPTASGQCEAAERGSIELCAATSVEPNERPDSASIDMLLAGYLMARGMKFPDGPDQALRVLAEAGELVEAWAVASYSHSPEAEHAVVLELADVVLACAVVASHVGVTVEAAIHLKTDHDRGRDNAHGITERTDR